MLVMNSFNQLSAVKYLIVLAQKAELKRSNTLRLTTGSSTFLHVGYCLIRGWLLCTRFRAKEPSVTFFKPTRAPPPRRSTKVLSGLAGALLLLNLTSVAAFQVYSHTDANGVITYSERPAKPAKIVKSNKRWVPDNPALGYVPGQSLIQNRPRAALAAPILPWVAQGEFYPFPWRGGPYRLSQGPGGSYSHQDIRSRYAMDIAMPEGTPIVAARSGRVLDIENNQFGAGPNPSGNFVRVLHSDGSTGVYLHLTRGSVRVQIGQMVGLGTLLALSGNTGHSNGPHLHFVVQRNSGAGWVSIPFQFKQTLQNQPNFALGGR